MAAGTITVYQNAAQSLRLHFTDAEGADIDLTGKTVTFYAAKGLGEPFLFDPVEVTSHDDAGAGVTYVPLTATDTNKQAHTYYYEIWLDETPSDMGALVIKETLRGSA